MTRTISSTALIILAAALAGCASNSITTGSTTPNAPADVKRATPVVAERPARMYIVTAFKEKDCAPLPADIQIITPPAKGAVSLKPGQNTLVQFSQSGKCIGQQIAGTGIYYTAKKGQSGVDTFTISATAGSGAPSTKTFKVNIAE